MPDSRAAPPAARGSEASRAELSNWQPPGHSRALLEDADGPFLATDEDREGEAIAWYLLETLSPKVPIRRMVRYEITPAAIQLAVETPRELDRALVNAREIRRVLDRLYGYEVSPVLWKKVMPKLSAGRVQPVATKVVVEREQAWMAFRVASYRDLDARLTAPEQDDPTAPRTMAATLTSLDGRSRATGRDFVRTTGLLKGVDSGAGAAVVHLDERKGPAEPGPTQFRSRSKVASTACAAPPRPRTSRARRTARGRSSSSSAGRWP